LTSFGWGGIISPHLRREEMPAFMLYSSEDEGFRSPVGTPTESLEEIELQIAEYTETKPLEFTEKQLENTSPPNVHGKVIRLYCLDGEEYSHMMDSEEKGYAYDWLYLIQVC